MILAGDCVELMATLEANSIDAIVTDPPYGLEFMGKEWDRLGAGLEEFAASDFGARDGNAFGQPAGGVHVRYGKSAKTMQDWHTRWAREAFRVAKPGAHLLAFGGTRTYHRLASAIEDAGWEIRDCLVWAYASGFPKSLDVSKAIDKAAGAEREKVAVGDPVKRMIPGADQNRTGDWTKNNGREYQPGVEQPATPDAQRWNGWGTALKPAWEPIVMARKPLVGTVAANVLRHGTGALNIDATRIGTEQTVTQRSGRSNGTSFEEYGKPAGIYEHDVAGRWPANVVLTDPIFDGGVDGVVGGGAVEGFAGATRRSAVSGGSIGWNPEEVGQIVPGYGDTGTYSRFFQLRGDSCYLCGRANPAGETSSPQRPSDGSVPDPARTEASPATDTTMDSPTTSETETPFWHGVEGSTPPIPRSKRLGTSLGSASRGESAKSPTVASQETGTTTTTGGHWTCDSCAVLTTSDTTGFWPGSTRFLLVPKAARSDREPVLRGQLEEGPASALRQRENSYNGSPPVVRENLHPTVKPVELMRHLVRLVTPPGGTVLDCFLGSGTTAIACELEGFAWIGMEREPEYVAIAEARLNGTQRGFSW